MREKILTSTQVDGALTATELRSKYGKDEEMKPRSPRPSFADAPRQRSFASSSSNLRPSGTPSAFDLDDGCGCGGRLSAAGTPSSVAVNGVCVRRCFLCGTTLRDPGVPYFACGACGALNGAEPRIQRAFDGCVFRGMCRSLSKRGRRVVGVVCALIAFVIAAGCRFVLPYVVDPASALSPASARHYALTAFLSLGTVFNYAATVLVGPGHVTTECNPLLPKARASPPKLEVAADDESNPLLQTPVRSSGGDDGANGGGGGGGGGGKEALARLIVERGEQPLRGWRRCEVTGLSMPPRSHYCRTCKAIVLRMDHHCMFTNSCIGWRNVRRRASQPARVHDAALASRPPLAHSLAVARAAAPLLPLLPRLPPRVGALRGRGVRLRRHRRPHADGRARRRDARRHVHARRLQGRRRRRQRRRRQRDGTGAAREPARAAGSRSPPRRRGSSCCSPTAG